MGGNDESFFDFSNFCDPFGIQVSLFANVKSPTQTRVLELIIFNSRIWEDCEILNGGI